MIEKLHPGSFKCFDEDNCVNILELKNNQLTKIKNGTFLDNRHLNELSLCNNFIHHLESNSFRGLTNLKSLTLRNNRIEIIPVSLFEDLQQLNTLDLSENFISSLQLHAFSGLTALEILNISHNNLETFTPTYLFPLGQLTDLDISDVKVHRLDLKEIMRHNSKLRNIILNDNFWKCNDLLDFYTEMNKFGGFSSPTQHYGVPNLHGIACSPRELDTYNDFTFAKFLKIVSTDAPLSDWFNFSPPTKDEQDHTMKYLRNIHGMFIFVLFSIVVLITCYVIKLVMRCLYDNNIVKFNRLSFLYLPGQRNVQVCS
ncbi:leucine-rich repeat-containing protein 70-like [Photinus pyralis]|nr:leucine-rich repeat-containing protein 70-like [Photinus pyralis]